ncbi:hypothetical protein EDB84DRAFT_1447138 [Lactarius hengduanensis]|nr:hypothetical protein EDB84DRAFT_1447138 [Lactarius hengduanensis]
MTTAASSPPLVRVQATPARQLDPPTSITVVDDGNTAAVQGDKDGYHDVPWQSSTADQLALGLCIVLFSRGTASNRLLTASDEWPAVGAALGFPPFPAGDPTQSLRESAWVTIPIGSIPGHTVLLNSHKLMHKYGPIQTVDAARLAGYRSRSARPPPQSMRIRRSGGVTTKGLAGSAVNEIPAVDDPFTPEQQRSVMEPLSTGDSLLTDPASLGMSSQPIAPIQHVFSTGKKDRCHSSPSSACVYTRIPASDSLNGPQSSYDELAWWFAERHSPSPSHKIPSVVDSLAIPPSPCAVAPVSSAFSFAVNGWGRSRAMGYTPLFPLGQLDNKEDEDVKVCKSPSERRSSSVELRVTLPENVETSAQAAMDVCDPLDAEQEETEIESLVQHESEENSTDSHWRIVFGWSCVAGQRITWQEWTLYAVLAGRSASLAFLAGHSALPGPHIAKLSPDRWGPSEPEPGSGLYDILACSPKCMDTAFSLMGGFRNVRRTPSLANITPSLFSIGVPATMYVTRTVVSVEREFNTFIVFVTQRVPTMASRSSQSVQNLDRTNRFPRFKLSPNRTR